MKILASVVRMIKTQKIDTNGTHEYFTELMVNLLGLLLKTLSQNPKSVACGRLRCVYIERQLLICYSLKIDANWITRII